jgi:dTDP-4-dehydrorhamnose reductase
VTRILVPGKNGQVGRELHGALAPLGDVVALDRHDMDLSSPDSIRAAIRAVRPDIIVNAAGYTTVDKAESEPELAMTVNGVAPGIIAEEAKHIGAILVHYSTDYVFDGTLDRPYIEEDAANPVNRYGATKLAGERAIEAVGGHYLILRTSWVYASRGSNFVLAILKRAREQTQLDVVDDQTGSPTSARALARATAAALKRADLARSHSGVYHLSAAGQAVRSEFAADIIRLASDATGRPDGWGNIRPVHLAQYRPRLPARRPLNPITSKDKIKRVFGIEMSHWQQQLRRGLADILGGSGPPAAN